MKILLVQIDKTDKPNLALEKIACCWRNQGAEIIGDRPFEFYQIAVQMPLLVTQANQVYASCIFDWNRDKCKRLLRLHPSAIIGGSGYDIRSRLADEVESIKPRINWGFTTRGCIRKCPFCVVPEKEGNIRIVGDLLDLWDGKSKTVTILDNNILAMPEHFKLVCKQAREHKIRLDFNQGLDFRLLTPEIVHELKITRTERYRFSFDDPTYQPGIEKALEMLRAGGINECFWYVLVGYNTTLQQDFDRLNFLKANKQKAYLQRYSKERVYIPMATWVNQHGQFAKRTFMQFLGTRKDRLKYKPLFEDVNTCVN